MRQLTAAQVVGIEEGLLEGLSQREIAGRVGCAQSTVGRVGQRLGVHWMRRNVPPRALAAAVERYERGQKVVVIRRMTGVWPTTLYAELRRRGVALRSQAVKREERDEQ